MQERTLRKIFDSFPYGLFILGSSNGSKISTAVVNWVTQVSFHPPMIAVAVEADSRLRESLESSMRFSLNALQAGARETARAFLKQVDAIGNSMNGQEFRLGSNAMPVFLDAASVLECVVTQSVQAGDHVVFLGEVVDAVLQQEGDILTLKETGWKYSR